MIQADMQELARAALAELLAWEELERSPRLALFLRYIVEQSLAENEPGIKAYSIAVDVFERPADFDPQTDPIVRVQAARLRGLLEKFYSSHLNKVPVRLTIPTGRYVPKVEPWPVRRPAFQADKTDVGGGESQAGTPTPPPIAPAIQHSTPRPSRTLLRAVIAILMFLILVALVAIWLLLSKFEGAGLSPLGDNLLGPEPPTVRIATFENLTGMASFDVPVSGLAAQLVSNLSRFEDLRVERGPLPDYVEKSVPPDDAIAPVYVLSGAVRREAGDINFDVLLTQANGPKVVWTYTISLPDTTQDLSNAIARVARSFSAVLGNHRGPLHIQNLQRLSMDKNDLGGANIYICWLLDTLARDVASVANSKAAADCFENLQLSQPESALALAGWAGNAAMIARADALLGDPLVDTLFEQTRAARAAVDMLPQSSFVYGQFARVMAAQHASQQSRIAHIEAIRRNPADMDAIAEYALNLAFSGELDGAIELMDIVFREGAAAPSWYQIVPALKGLRDKDYNGALSSALTVMGSDPELGMVLALSAAPLAARGDVVRRYANLARNNENFQRMGILPWVSRLITDEGVLRLLDPGLQLAGLSSDIIRHPFAQGAK